MSLIHRVAIMERVRVISYGHNLEVLEDLTGDLR